VTFSVEAATTWVIFRLRGAFSHESNHSFDPWPKNFVARGEARQGGDFRGFSLSPDVARTLLWIGFSLQLPYLCSAGVDHALRWFAAPAQALAALSYTLYLIHYPVNLALDHVFAQAPEITAQSFAAMLARITIWPTGICKEWGLLLRNAAS
jgi:hypothetical protein